MIMLPNGPVSITETAAGTGTVSFHLLLLSNASISELHQITIIIIVGRLV